VVRAVLLDDTFAGDFFLPADDAVVARCRVFLACVIFETVRVEVLTIEGSPAGFLGLATSPLPTAAKEPFTDSDVVPDGLADTSVFDTTRASTASDSANSPTEETRYACELSRIRRRRRTAIEAVPDQVLPGCPRELLTS
jgi:hypothetical protein